MHAPSVPHSPFRLQSKAEVQVVGLQGGGEGFGEGEGGKGALVMHRSEKVEPPFSVKFCEMAPGKGTLGANIPFQAIESQVHVERRLSWELKATQLDPGGVIRKAEEEKVKV